jgi:hypothetical protein
MFGPGVSVEIYVGVVENLHLLVFCSVGPGIGKGLRKVEHFLLQIFALLFSYPIFKQIFNVLSDKN